MPRRKLPALPNRRRGPQIPPGAGLLEGLRAVLDERRRALLDVVMRQWPDRAWTDADVRTLYQVARLTPEGCERMALRAARHVARWTECGAVGASVRRKLVASLREAGEEVPEVWAGISACEAETARDREREREGPGVFAGGRPAETPTAEAAAALVASLAAGMAIPPDPRPQEVRQQPRAAPEDPRPAPALDTRQAADAARFLALLSRGAPPG